MTNEEAKSYILQNWFDGDKSVEAVVDGDEEIRAMVKAVKALEKADKYKWHDLRKNPDDLPEDGQRVLFKTIPFEDKNEYGIWSGNFNKYGSGNCTFDNDDYEAWVTKGFYTLDEVIAWRYIEPFEEVES